MKSLFVCFYHIDHHIIVKIDCQEKHSFQPFASNETNSARTKIFQTMVLIKEENAIYISHPDSKLILKCYLVNDVILIFHTLKPLMVNMVRLTYYIYRKSKNY